MARPRKYPIELRERSVRLVFESGRPVTHVARDLGVYPEALRSWVRQARADSGERRELLTSEERQRLKELERENRELRRANEILKAASAFLATEPDITTLPAFVTRDTNGLDVHAGSGPDLRRGCRRRAARHP